jgi:SWIM zinc finger
MIRNPKKAATIKKEFPHGFLLSESAQYAFLCQEVYPDIISFAAAIPDHLKPLFLIPIMLETVHTAALRRIASRVAGDGPTSIGDGGEDEASWFGTKTFKYEDNEPTVPSSEPGSIFDTKDGEADSLTHHQEYNFDENIQTPTDTSYMNDVDMTQYWDYPYRTKEQPVRHSFFQQVAILQLPWRAHLALKPKELERKAPSKIQNNARSCRVSLTSYDKKNRVFTFNVDCGHGAKTVQASLSDVDKVALSCNCPFWRYNGPEFHAANNSYMLGQPFGTAAPPDIRDPDRKYFLCKHAYSVLKRFDDFVQEVAEENFELDDDELLNQIDEDWDRLEGVADVPIDELDEDIDIDWDEEPDDIEPEPVEEAPEEVEEPVDEYEVDLSDLDEPEEYDVDLSELEPDYVPPEEHDYEISDSDESEDYQAVEDALEEDNYEPEKEEEEESDEEDEDYEQQ